VSESSYLQTFLTEAFTYVARTISAIAARRLAAVSLVERVEGGSHIKGSSFRRGSCGDSCGEHRNGGEDDGSDLHFDSGRVMRVV